MACIVLLINVQACGPAHSGSGQNVSFRGHSYHTFTAVWPKDKIRFYWKDSSGQKLKSIGRLREYVEAKGHTLLFATNGGMYMENNNPLGLYIENGKEKARLNLSLNGKGNFYLQPNGVFYLTAQKAKIVSTEKFNPYRDSILYATQSGPMLVVDGEVNKIFAEKSQNVNIRSGVGTADDGKVVFAISDESVNFYEFASFFKDVLKCRNALFLDGAISRMYIPAMSRTDQGGNFGVMIGVEK